jgi:hypothetical protein
MPQKAPAASQPKPNFDVVDPAKPEVKPPAPKPRQTVIELEFPVTFAGQVFDRLTVRRIKAKDFRQLDVLEGGGNAAAIAMAALICNVDEAIIDELDAVDYVKVQEAIADFFPPALVDKLQAKPSQS